MDWVADTYITNNLATTSYRLYLDDNSGNGEVLYYDTSLYAFTTKAIVSGLSLGNTYYLTVRAVNAIGESGDSNVLTIHAGTVPSKITSVTLKTSTTTSITVQWTPPANNGGLTIS